METTRVPALAGLLKLAGFTWASADEITNVIDSLKREGCSSDDVAAALFKWRALSCRRTLGAARTKAAQMMVGNGTDARLEPSGIGLPEQLEEPDQLALFATSDEQQRFNAKWPIASRK
jgi:hypothetical protein